MKSLNSTYTARHYLFFSRIRKRAPYLCIKEKNGPITITHTPTLDQNEGGVIKILKGLLQKDKN